MRQPSLRDDVVALRPWRAEDLAAAFAAFSDPLVQRFVWTRSEPYTEADAWAYFEEAWQAWEAGTGAEFAAVEPDDELAILGGASIHHIETHQQRAGVGYWLAAHARGRGIATHAVRLLVRWAFDELGIVRLELTCGPDNEASQRVAERCGFTREAVLRSHLAFKGGRRDTVVFSLLAGDAQDLCA